MKKLMGLLVALMLLLAALLFLEGFRFNATASMPRGIYQLVVGTTSFQRGDPVSLCFDVEPFATLARDRGYLRPGSCPDGLQPLLKVVAGLPGDILEIGQDGIRINGRLQPGSRVALADSHARPMPESLLASGTIPEGMVLVLSGEHPGSFDGRYFGLVPLASLKKVRPIRMFTP